MAKYRIMYWQEIPSVVEAREGREKAKRELSQRFQELIDLVAMRRKLDGSDEYLLHWSKGEWQTHAGTAENVVNLIADEIEAEYEATKTAALEKST
jgi:cvfA/B/C family virulence factor